MVRPAAGLGKDTARHGKDVAPFVEGQVGRNQGAAAQGCFDDDRRRRHAGDDSVPGREIPGQRLDAKGILGNDGAAVLDDLPEQGLVFPGISPVQAVGSDDDGPPLPLQGAPVGPRVDAPGTAADDGKALGRQFGSQ